MDSVPLEKLAHRIRHDILTMTTAAGSGHPTSSLSAVELMTALFFKYLRYDVDNPKNSGNDRVIFSKGHASPLYYALYAAAGAISQEELSKYRTFDSILEGHPTERFKYTEAATGSLGQGLAIGLGEALGIRMINDQRLKIKDKTPNNHKSFIIHHSSVPRVFVLSGDGELAEGSVWEAAAAASFRKMSNLFFLVDVNRLGQSDPTMYEHDLSVYQKRFEAFGWRVVVVEKGNDLSEVEKGLGQALDGSGPTVVLAKTVKGAGISFLEGAEGWHGKALSKEELTKALAELGEVDLSLHGNVIPAPEPESIKKNAWIPGQARDDKIEYPKDKPVATRKAFGNALKRLGGAQSDLVVLDGDVKNSTYTEFFGKEFPDRFLELFIAEQNLAGVAVGLSARGYHPVVSTFACFLTRAADQIRMAAFSGANILVNGSHAGVSIGEDGPSQMGLEDLSQFRAVHGSTVFYPSDAISTERLVEVALQQKGIVYIRTTRPETPILYGEKETFPVGGSKVFESRITDYGLPITVVSAGVTLHEALKAQRELEKQGVGIRVIDCYSVKPIDVLTLKKAAKETKAIIVVEDHYPEGGLGEAVMSALASDSGDPHVKVCHLAVRKTPRSGRAAELLAYEEIDANAIIKAARQYV